MFVEPELCLRTDGVKGELVRQLTATSLRLRRLEEITDPVRVVRVAPMRKQTERSLRRILGHLNNRGTRRSEG